MLGSLGFTDAAQGWLYGRPMLECRARPVYMSESRGSLGSHGGVYEDVEQKGRCLPEDKMPGSNLL